MFFASVTIASLGLFSSVVGLSGSADDEPKEKNHYPPAISDWADQQAISLII
jgi:hypothetical protein